MKFTLPGTIAAAGVAMLLALGLSADWAPRVRPAASAGDFSTERALAHVRAIATRPHPVGSPANADVRQYLIDEAARLGLRAQVQSGVMRGRVDLDPAGGRAVQNVIVRVPGARSARGQAARSILVVCHHDSVVAGPGAGDDTAAVAAMLEVLRCLRAGPPLEQDVTLLITDGEEGGLRGARLFCADATPGYKFDVDRIVHDSSVQPHPELERAALVLNFDARGTSGPSIMYETGPGNLELLRHFGKAAPSPVANSFTYDVYKMLRNDSDFTVFRRAGKQGLNFAFIGDYVYYHTAGDTPENLNPGSLRHDGIYALALVRHFANLDDAALASITAPGQRDAVYFSVPPGALVRYPATWIWPLTVVQILLALVAITLAWRRGMLSGLGLVGAAVRLALALVVAPAAVFGLASWMGRPYTAAGFDGRLAAIVAVTVLVAVTIALTPVRFFRRAARAPGAADRTAVGLIVLSILSVAINRSLPGGSFVVWAGICLALALLARQAKPECPWLTTIAAPVGAAPTALVIAPLALLLFTALTLTDPRLVAGLSSVVVLTVWLLLGAYVPPRPAASVDS